MFRRTHVAALAAAALAFTTSWHANAQALPTARPAPAASAANRGAAALVPASSPEALGFDSQRLAKLDAYMAKAVTDERVAGMSTLLARHGRVVSEKTYGY